MESRFYQIHMCKKKNTRCKSFKYQNKNQRLFYLYSYSLRGVFSLETEKYCKTLSQPIL